MVSVNRQHIGLVAKSQCQYLLIPETFGKPKRGPREKFFFKKRNDEWRYEKRIEAARLIGANHFHSINYSNKLKHSKEVKVIF